MGACGISPATKLRFRFRDAGSRRLRMKGRLEGDPTERRWTGRGGILDRMGRQGTEATPPTGGRR
jgi:hypothetical protein